MDNFNRDGIHRNGTMYDENGFNIFGFNRDGIHRNRTRYDDRGFDSAGYYLSGWYVNHDDRDVNGDVRYNDGASAYIPPPARLLPYQRELLAQEEQARQAQQLLQERQPLPEQPRPVEFRDLIGPESVPFDKSKIAEYAEKFKCKICQENEVNSILVKCGHGICRTCYSKINPSGQPSVIRCPWCREPASVVPLFLVGGYKQKYLKYKKKYLELKNKL
jgi:hypothetical protein